MSDIVEDLKECAKYAHEYPSDRDLLKGAAKEITRLREELTSAKRAAEAYEAWKFPEDIQALTVENEHLREENARLREALKPFAAMMDGEHMQAFAEALDSDWTRCVVTIGDLRAALAALKGEKNG